MKQMFMLTSSRIAGSFLLGLGLYAAATGVRAFEAADGAQVEKAPLKSYAAPTAALKAGLGGVRLGNPATSIDALKVAAQGGDRLAQWKLANIYAKGDGIPRDDVKAYDYFSQIVKGYDEDSPDRRGDAIVSRALVALGAYRLNGIENSAIVADPQLALRLFQFAATNFGDANAQYNLARMHLDGVGGDKDELEALRWLCLAAQKGQVDAKALLGQLRPDLPHLGTGSGARCQ
jgi:uncharacterized protein